VRQPRGGEECGTRGCRRCGGGGGG
jgi:hypothetical protein